MPEIPYTRRQADLIAALQSAGLDAIALNPGPSLVYFTGLHFHLSERPVLAWFAPGKPVVLALPELEAAKLEGLPFPLQPFLYPENPSAWAPLFARAAEAAGLTSKSSLGLEPVRLRLLELRLLEEALPGARFLSAEKPLADQRMYKDPGEVAAMRKAVEIAEAALQAALPRVKAGVTEREIASELTLQILRLGSDSEMPFTPIVSGGPNSANPHAVPGSRPLQPGDLLVIDWGAAWQGYFSDITRTFAIGEPEPEMWAVAAIVQEANAAGRLAARPGVPAGAVDQAARAVIDAAGYGPYFTHRTGHGLGLESHEPPYIRSDTQQLLASGMAFTVEPGIYLPGRNGVRIEDNVVITPSGCDTLTTLPRELIVLE